MRAGLSARWIRTCEFEYLNDNHGAKAIASGELTGEAFVAAVREVNAFAVNTKAIFYTFCDFNHLTRISVAIGDLAPVAMCAIEAAKLRDTERVVAAYAGDEYTYRLALV